MLQRNGTRTARIESNNGGRGFARAVAKLCLQTRIEWFHQYRNKEARVLSNATEVAARIRMPEDWHRRWSNFTETWSRSAGFSARTGATTRPTF